MMHPDVSTFGDHHIYIGIQFSSPLPMYLTATYIGVTHIRRIPMYPTMTRAGKDFDGDTLGRGLLFMINFPRGSSFPTENTSAQLIPTTKQYLCTRVMSGISGTSVSSPSQNNALARVSYPKERVLIHRAGALYYRQSIRLDCTGS